MQQTKHITVIAGEESGDQHAAAFIKRLKSNHPDWKFTGIGGSHMQDAGVMLISDLARFGVTGITEVLMHARVIRDAFRRIQAHLTNHPPDLLILVDYPGFNLRLAKFAKQQLNLKILFYISPQIWAWKANRIHTIKRYVDHMAVILPFEKMIYAKAGIPVTYVGHPLVSRLHIEEPIPVLKQRLDLPKANPILAILPGSRRNEIKRLLPILVEVVQGLLQSHPDLHIVIPVARSLKKEMIAAYFNPALPITFVAEQADLAVHCSDFVIVASGTASLECALLTKPMCIVYKTSLVTFIAACQFMRVKYLGLCNLLQNKMIVPELLQYDCTAHELITFISDLMNDKTKAARMIARLQNLKHKLSTEAADKSIEQLIEAQGGAGEFSY